MSAFQVQPIFDIILQHPERAIVELFSGISISGILLEVGKFAGLVAVAWGILKYKAVADVTPLLSKEFVTIDKFDAKIKDLTCSVASTASDKAALATQPLASRLDKLEDSFEEFRDGAFKDHRSEMRELFKEVFTKLDEVRLDNAKSHKKEPT